MDFYLATTTLADATWPARCSPNRIGRVGQLLALGRGRGDLQVVLSPSGVDECPESTADERVPAEQDWHRCVSGSRGEIAQPRIANRLGS